MSKPRITNKNCRSPWTLGYRIRHWEVVYKDERLTHKDEELYVERVLIDARDVFVTIKGEGNDPQALTLTDLANAKRAPCLVLSQRRFRFRWGWRVRVLVAIEDSLIDVTHLI